MVTFEDKNLWNNRKKQQFQILTQIIFDRKNGEFDLSLAHVRYHFSLKYHRAL